MRSTKKALVDRIAAIDKERPKPLPVAEIVTDGDYRFAPDGEGDEVIGCPKCRVWDVSTGSFLHSGPGRYEAPPSHFLLRGDPNLKGSVMKPGFVTAATYGNPPTEMPPADGRTSGRRRALAEWLASPQNPLTARVMVNRIWHHHFGRGIVATLDNFGKMGELPTHPELLDWLAVEFMNRGWSIKQMHRLMMTSEAYQMASSYEDAANREEGSREPVSVAVSSAAARCGDRPRQHHGGGRRLNLTIGGPPVFPPIPKELLAEANHGIWKSEADGPDVWRRSVYVYRKRGLAFPMFQVFDLPEQNVTSAARQRVDGADAGADADQRCVRAAAGAVVRGAREKGSRGRSRQSRSISRIGSRWRGRRRGGAGAGAGGRRSSSRSSISRTCC